MVVAVGGHMVVQHIKTVVQAAAAGTFSTFKLAGSAAGLNIGTKKGLGHVQDMAVCIEKWGDMVPLIYPYIFALFCSHNFDKFP